MIKISYTVLYVAILALWLRPSLGCKSSSYSCPPNQMKIPSGYLTRDTKDLPGYYKYIGEKEEDYRQRKCLRSEFMCDGVPDFYDMEFRKVEQGIKHEMRPDEDFCGDLVCSKLALGRTLRCPGTTRCIVPPTKFFTGTNIPIGPICEEVSYVL